MGSEMCIRDSSGIDGKYSYLIRSPVGVAGLIVPANTPLANIAWKIFPSLICGNGNVLKSSEDAPFLAYSIGKLALASGLPKGILNVIHGDANTGSALVTDENVDLISFTGSSSVGKAILNQSSNTLKKVSLELGGKNALVILSDADLSNAIKWSILSSFSNAGQRCAATSRIYIDKDIYLSLIHI